MSPDERFMQRALGLAPLGVGYVSPNPLVGCVLVHENRIIGEGWHQRYGEAHAEVNAVNSVENQALLREATAYVTLEPCSHWGKTPPCADLLIRHGLKRVVVCNDDPNPLVAGQGLAKLRAAGIEVTTGVLADQGRTLNRRFFTAIEQQRPYVILKWAETADGYLAGPNGEPIPISNRLSQQLVHRWRSEEDAILVGTNTALRDNPRLDVRHWTGRNPVRVVLDRRGTLPPALHLFDGTPPTIRYTEAGVPERPGVTTARLEPAADLFPQILKDLHARRIQSVLIEGGTRVLQSLLDSGTWDEIRRFRSPKVLGRGVPAPVLQAASTTRERLMGDELSVFFGKVFSPMCTDETAHRFTQKSIL
jgi:diaminohydroxyphosphoribosylaminopyrimidine deaminase/5-amino-6-(5-phosphoribosylamino)uracil reductase